MANWTANMKICQIKNKRNVTSSKDLLEIFQEQKEKNARYEKLYTGASKTKDKIGVAIAEGK